MLKEHEKGSYNFKWIRCINDIFVAVGRPDLFKTDPVNNIFCENGYFSNIVRFVYLRME